jgi:hypothetical protein
MFEGPLKPLSSERVAAPKVPKEFEEEAKWHREAADEEATRRRLQGEPLFIHIAACAHR